MIVQAHSSTGKTVALCVSILQSINTTVPVTQALVLCPTRELATKIQTLILALGSYMFVRCHACLGGNFIDEDIRKLHSGQHVVSGTPGRVFDMILKKQLGTGNIKILALDEGDELMYQDFEEQIHRVYQSLQPPIQVLFFSIIIPEYVGEEVAVSLMTNPLYIIAKHGELAPEDLKQFFVPVEREEWKLAILRDLCDKLAITQIVIFCDTAQKASRLRFCNNQFMCQILLPEPYSILGFFRLCMARGTATDIVRFTQVDLLAEELHAVDLATSTMHDGMGKMERDDKSAEFHDGTS